MTQKTTKPKQLNIYQKLLAIQKKNLAFTKNADNPFFKSKYITLDELIKGLNPELNELDLIVVHKTRQREVITLVIDTATGKNIQSRFPIPEAITDPQKMGSAITYAKRYNIGQLFNIMTDIDDDGNATVNKSNNQTNEISEQEKPF